jgi:hypothetical protein
VLCVRFKPGTLPTEPGALPLYESSIIILTHIFLLYNRFRILFILHYICRSGWPRDLRRRSAAARLLRLWVRIPSGAWMSVCCDCCVLSGRCLCDELITRPEESYRLWCVVVCDLQTSWMRRPWPTGGCCVKRKKEHCTYTNKIMPWRTNVM